MMWKKKLHHSTRVSAIVSRAITSKDFGSSVSISALHDSAIFSSRSLFSSLSSLSLSRLEQRPFPSARSLLFSNLSSILARENAVSFVKVDNSFSSLSESAAKLHCWNCGAEAADATSFLFCQACRSVQAVNESIDYFQIFGLGRKYSIEVGELEKKYKDWQKKLHPDLVHSKTQREREYAAEQSARVIDAYRTLADPLSRAIYIMKLEGMPVDEEERITDPELLAEIMELREAVDEAEDAHALNQIQAQLQEKLRDWSNSFEEAYMRKNFEDGLASIRRMTYYKRANEEIVKKL
ncbi:iron-sulfur cluster co-chaperone protein HscB homolog [Salvia miltiorrhiza]|uniref:iron-sulfur cluster co-chaperone protein HscB homolog n=1 Tax=Salvia miltiorrhiza TaxID=226208 RepID=UPI0025ACD02B|nr:iron-sulfur cluster co-chaperone protein HscB homolog [Salvia miltiorrhiza]